MSLHDEIINIRCPENRIIAFQDGHRSARHAAAELALKEQDFINSLSQSLLIAVNKSLSADAEIERLKQELENARRLIK